MVRLMILAVVLSVAGASGAGGQDPDEVKRLKERIELLEGKIKSVEREIQNLKRENEQLKAGGAKGALGQRGGGESYDSLAYWPSSATVLTHDEIARYLKLTAAEQESIGKAYAEHQQTRAAFPPRTSQNTEEVSRKLTEANEKLNDAVRRALGDKAKRIDQITAQSAGLANAFVTRLNRRAPRLALTPAQLAKGREILEAAYKEMTPGDFSAKSHTTFVDKTTPKLLELLTDEQKKLWQEATGEPVPAEILAMVRGGPKRESKK